MVTYHNDYLEYLEIWTKIRNVLAGEEKIKQAGEKYLPKLDGQTTKQYNSYRTRALLYNATARSVEAYMGMIFRKPVTIELPVQLEERKDNVSLENESVTEFLKRIAREVTTVSRCGVLVDFPTVETGDLRRAADVDVNTERAYAAMYLTEDIINWRLSYENGNTAVKSVLLREEYYSDEEDEFPSEIDTQYRLLKINEDGYYEQQIIRDNGDGEQVVSRFEPIMQGERMTEIPFYFFGITDNTPTPEKPPLIDLVNINLSHYRSSADYEHGIHWTALPTLAITGADPNELGDIALGPEGGIVLESPDSQVKMLEFTGKGLDQIESALDRKEQMMADLGARIIMDVENATDAAETVQLKQQGQNSVLGNIADTVARGYTRVLETIAMWDGVEEPEVSVDIVKDFVPWKIDPKMVQVLMAAWQENRITFETFMRNLQRGEIISEDMSADDYRAELERQRLEFPSEL